MPSAVDGATSASIPTGAPPGQGLPRPAVRVGSNTMRLWRGNPKEQAWEGIVLAATFGDDLAVVRDLDPDYLAYWSALVGGCRAIDAGGSDPGEYLTRVLLDDRALLDAVRAGAPAGAHLAAFFPTALEQELAAALGIPLHGNPAVGDRFGTKTGVRDLALAAGVEMPPGRACRARDEVAEAAAALSGWPDGLVVKHDLSAGGDWSARWRPGQGDPREVADAVCGGRFVEGRDAVVVEAWLPAAASPCAHVEIPAGGEPSVCAVWEQVLADDGRTQVGSRSPRLPPPVVAEVAAPPACPRTTRSTPCCTPAACPPRCGRPRWPSTSGCPRADPRPRRSATRPNAAAGRPLSRAGRDGRRRGAGIRFRRGGARAGPSRRRPRRGAPRRQPARPGGVVRASSGRGGDGGRPPGSGGRCLRRRRGSGYTPAVARL